MFGDESKLYNSLPNLERERWERCEKYCCTWENVFKIFVASLLQIFFLYQKFLYQFIFVNVPRGGEWSTFFFKLLFDARGDVTRVYDTIKIVSIFIGVRCVTFSWKTHCILIVCRRTISFIWYSDGLLDSLQLSALHDSLFLRSCIVFRTVHTIQWN